MSTTAIKIVALVFMTIDHIGTFFPNIPIWFRYIGRLSAVLFFFASAWGFYYTHDKKLYMKRLYKYSLLMCIIDFIIPIFITNTNYNLDNNIFSSILVADIFIYLVEITKNDAKKRKKYLGLFFLYQLGVSILVLILNMIVFGTQWFVSMANILKIPYLLESLISTALCCAWTAEGPLYLTAILPLIYFSMHDKKKLTRNYLIYNICFFAIVVTQIVPRGFMFLERYLIQLGVDNYFTILSIIEFPFAILGFRTLSIGLEYNIIQSMFQQNYQWFMIFALPIMLMYNGKKGKGLKKLFYVYYPVHIVVLYIVGALIT